VGKGDIDRELKRLGRPYTPAQRDEICYNIGSRMGYHQTDDLYNALGYGGITIAKISTKLKDEFDRLIKPIAPEPPVTEQQIQVRPHKKNFSGVIVDGVDGCEVKFAKCCNPLPGDRILGFITKGFGISIHKQDCPNAAEIAAKEENRDRFVSAFWDDAVMQSKHGSENLYEAHLQIFAENDIMLLANITRALADMKVTLHQINTQNKDGEMILNLTVGCKNTDHFTSIISRMRSIDKVTDVKRGYA
jgi:GTP pyrophosphokinase